MGLGTRIRPATAITIGALALLVLAPPAPRAQDGQPRRVRVETVSQSPQGFEVRVLFPALDAREETVDGRAYARLRMPGAAFTTEPGAPQVPLRGIGFGQPAGARVVADVEVVRSRRFQGLPPAPAPTPRIDDAADPPVPVEDVILDPAAYRGGVTPAVWGKVSEATHSWRFTTLGAVELYPVRVDPAVGAYEVAEEMRVTVRFLDVPPRAPGKVAVVEDEPGFEAALDQVVVNAASARRFRTRERPQPVRGLLSLSQDRSQVRLRVSGTAPARVAFADLAAAGFPSGTPVGEVRVEERGYDASRPQDPFTAVNLPRVVEDANANGVFDEGDRLVFMAFNFEDRFRPTYNNARYSVFHTYWVTADAAGGAAFPRRDGFPAGSYQPVASFPWTVVQEQDRLYINFPGETTGTFEPLVDAWYWTSPLREGANLTVTFDVPDPDPAASATIRVCSEFQGAFVGGETGTHHVWLTLNGTEILTDRIFRNTEHVSWCSGFLPGSRIHDGQNEMIYKARSGVLNPTLENSGSYWDGFQLTYNRLLRARNNLLRFNSGDLAGNLQFAVTGFTSDRITVWDITDPVAPVAVDGQVQADGAGFRVLVRDTVGAARRQYLAFVPESVGGLPQSRELPPDLAGTGPIQAASGRDLLQAGEDADYIIIAHPSLRDGWQGLIELRESQGHRVFLCDVWEVYDQFSGGNKDPDAILAFLTRAFASWERPPAYLLLGGDASEDYRHDNPTGAGVDWVPTMMHLANVPGALSVRELAGTDTYLVSALEAGDRPRDPVPDMFVGRVPANNPSDVQTMVQKITAYERMDPNDAWRNRGVFLADDQYSTGITSTTLYCYRPQEELFSRTTGQICEAIRTEGLLTDFECIEVHVAAALDTVDALRRCHDPSLVEDNATCDGINTCPSLDGRSLILDTVRYTRENITPGFIQELSRGQLVWSYTGHANKSQITSERLFASIGSERDVSRINNVGRPFIFEGFACHLNEFEYWNERTTGRSIGEELLLAPNRGAVASLASTGYEWLHTNSEVQLACTAPLFWEVPRDPDTGKPRRILGEATTVGLIRLAAEWGFSGDFAELMRTYFLLGDPGLRVDIAPPGLRVEVEGNHVEPGFPLTADSLEDSLLIQVRVSEDTDVAEGGFRVLDGATELPADRILIQSVSEGTGAQIYEAAFRTPCRLGTYDVVIEVADWFGRQSRFVLPVRFLTDFYSTPACLSPDTEETTRALVPGGNNLLDTGEAVRGVVQSPVPLEPQDFRVFVDGGQEPAPAVFTRLDESGRNWSFDVSPGWSAGGHTVRLVAARSGQEVERSIGFSVSEGALELERAPFFYPNPAGAAGALHYRLSRGAESGEVTIYTASGRRVSRNRVDCHAGDNRFTWDLRDEEGAEVANGVYLFVLQLDGFAGESVRHVEKVAVTR